MELADNVTKRRLPSWMLPKNPTPENHDKPCSSSSQQQPPPQKKSITRKRNNNTAIEDAETAEETERSARCEAKKRARIGSRVDEGNSVNRCDGLKKRVKKGTVKGGRKGTKNVVDKRMKSNDAEVDDGVELTIEDLMSIAQEYVKTDGAKHCGLSATSEFPSETNPSSMPASYRANMREPSQDNESCQMSSRSMTTCRDPDLIVTVNDKENPKAENFASDITSTGDVAQDMLELFLGPLLKKPRLSERDLKAV